MVTALNSQPLAAARPVQSNQSESSAGERLYNAARPVQSNQSESSAGGKTIAGNLMLTSESI